MQDEEYIIYDLTDHTDFFKEIIYFAILNKYKNGEYKVKYDRTTNEMVVFFTDEFKQLSFPYFGDEEKYNVIYCKFISNLEMLDFLEIF
jgi:hypothetical protein